MLEKKLFKLLLSHEFYTQNKASLKRGMFPKELGALFDTIIQAHEKYGKDLSLDELKELHYVFNPALTVAAKHNLEIVLADAAEEGELSSEVGTDILQTLYRREYARSVAQAAIEVINGKTDDLSHIRKAIENYSETPLPSNLQCVPDELEEILDGLGTSVKWHFNLPGLREKAGGTGPGIVWGIAARPEVGKSAFWVSLCCAPDGFCHQGAIVHAFINEERAIRTKARAITACTGRTLQEIKDDIGAASADYAPIKERIQCYDAVGITLEDIEVHVETYHPDIVVVDQADKVKVEGNFNRGDEALRAIYVGLREIAKKNNVAIFAVSQLSADAEGKMSVDYSMLENSKTGKAAETDGWICIGANPATAEFLRQINLPKNKITGDHSSFVCHIIPQLSRYEM